MNTHFTDGVFQYSLIETSQGWGCKGISRFGEVILKIDEYRTEREDAIRWLQEFARDMKLSKVKKGRRIA